VDIARDALRINSLKRVRKSRRFKAIDGGRKSRSTDELTLLWDSGNYKTENFYRCLRFVCDHDLLNFLKYFLQTTEGTRFILSPHHLVLADFAMKVVRGEIKRGIINLPPGTTKTELFVKSLIAWTLGENPRARFIHLSASSDLALRNSDETRTIVESEDYQKLYPETKIRKDKKAVKYWRTLQGGGVYATSTGGSVIGFRAGRMEEEFSGCIVVDDPHKPEDIFSDLRRTRQNARFTNTIRTRVAKPETPILIVMQRLHEDDLSGYLLKGGSGDVWDHLILPVIIPEENEPYPTEYTHGSPVPHGLAPGLLWEFKYDYDEIKILEADDYTFQAQFMQCPRAYGGGVFDIKKFRFYRGYDPATGEVILQDGSRVKILRKEIYADTAMKTGEHNDFSVFQCWGLGEDGHIYLLDQARGKWEAPVLKSKFLKFCEKHEYRNGEVGLGVRGRYVEDKASGTGLIQEIQLLKGKSYVKGIPRDRDKLSRARSGTIPIAEGKVYLPLDVYWIDDYLFEFRQFSPMDSHEHDDQIDPTLDAIANMLTKSSTLEKYLKIVGGKKNGRQ